MSHRVNSTSAFLLLLIALLAIPVFSASAAGAEAKGKNQKVIDFDDEVVEGVNKRPLDSLSTLSEAEKRRRRAHLYRKRAGFRSETTQTLQTLRYVQ